METVTSKYVGRTEYSAAWEEQKRFFNALLDAKRNGGGQAEQVLLFVEHPHVYTLGKSGHASNLLVDDGFLKRIGATYFQTDRGGDITYHGPGQIVGYPRVDLDNFSPDIHLYVHLLEETVIRTLSDFAIHSGRCPGRSGVWIDPQSPSARKICAIGVRTSRWVTMHGFALNVNTDLRYFSHIVPCGISDRGVTSLERETGTPADTEAVKSSLLRHFSEVFDCHIAPFPED